MNSLPPVIARMKALVEGWEAVSDRRAIFLSCYSMMTANMLKAVGEGAFEDSVWVSRLLHRFADYYFEAVDSYDRDCSCSNVWKVTFETAARPDTHVMVNLILGVNAHINYDLVLALGDILEREWADMSAGQRQIRYHDHRRVNDIIAGTINSVQDEVVERYEPEMDIVDKLMGPLDEWLITQLISNWREEVWENACEMMGCAESASSESILLRVEHNALDRAEKIAGAQGLKGMLTLARPA